jgi:hypothetical protein
MTSLKAVKTAVQKPSEVELILTDKQKLSYAPMVALCAKAYGYELESEKLTQLQGKANLEFAMNFVNIIRDNELSYHEYQALKKHTIQSIASAKHIEYASVEKWFNPIIKGYIKNDLSDGYELPKAEGRSAKGMTAIRTALASLTMQELEQNIQASAKAGDFKKASQLAVEKKRRVSMAENQVKKAEAKRLAELKSDLRAFIGQLDSNGLVAMMYVKNHFDTIKQMAIES